MSQTTPRRDVDFGEQVARRVRPSVAEEIRLSARRTGEPTGEARVNAERAKRAGDRAVTAWARANSGALRRLAGQISAPTGLATPAQQRIDHVQAALADNDPATLLSPLADSATHLEATHAALAAEINTITEHTERLRHQRRRQRT